MSLQTSSVFTEQSQKCVKNMNPFMIERGNPLWEDNRVPHSCQPWSRQTCLWIMMIMLTKIFYCKDTENEMKKLSQQDRLSTFCMDAGFLNVVEIGQYFMTNDTAEFSQFTDAVTCREYTLPRDEEASAPKGWTRGNTKIGPVLENATCCLQSKHGVEIRIMSMNKDNFHSWVRVSHGLNKLVTNLNNNEQENSEGAVRRVCVEIECRWFCKPIKGQSKTTKTRFCQLIHRNFSYWRKNLDRCWTRRIFFLLLWSVKEIDSSPSSWKSTPRRRWSDWILENQRQSSETFLVLSSLFLRKVEEKHGKRRRKQERYPVLYWFIRNNLVPPSSSRSFRTQSHWSYFIGQCHYSGRFIKYISHVGCAINLHSIINSGLISGSQILSNRQTVFFLPVDPMDKNHKDPDTIDLEAPRLAQYMHKAWKKHQNAVYWVDFNLALTKR